MKVILLVPMYNCSDIIDDWTKYILQLDPKPDKIIFCENNSNDSTLEKLINFPYPHEVIRFYTREPREIPFSNAYDIIAHARQLLLTKARKIDPDYAIFIDSDILIKSEDVITSLTDWNVDVVGGAYLRWFPEGLHVASLWKSPKWNYMPWRLYTAKGFNQMKKAIQEVYATSAGCLCLSRKVIQDRRLDFYPIPKGYSEDFGYCHKARQLGYKIWLDGITILTHRIRGKWKSWNTRREKEETRKEYDKKE